MPAERLPSDLRRRLPPPPAFDLIQTLCPWEQVLPRPVEAEPPRRRRLYRKTKPDPFAA